MPVLTPASFRLGPLAGLDPVIAAPMCGISDRATRDMVRQMGCALAFSEMISAEGFRRHDGPTWRLLDHEGEAPPRAVQIFGACPEAMAQAAALLVETGVQVVDINAGCPAKKVVNGGSGAALLRDLDRLRQIVRAVRRAVPADRAAATLKIRSGWDAQSLVDLEVARMAEGEGLDALTLHPRVRAQAFSGHADWARIAAVKQAIAIPVVGNGDVWSGADARRMARQTGCDAVMVGRGYMGNPWVFQAVAQGLLTDRPEADIDQPPPVAEKIAAMVAHTRAMAGRKGERRGVIESRKLVHRYLKGIPNARPLKMALMETVTLEQVEEAVARHGSALGMGMGMEEE